MEANEPAVHLALAAAALTALALPASSGAHGPRSGDPAPRAPVLVELFTSEGCSSCPPAEAVLAGVVRDQPVPGARVVLLAWHVTYWDALGWKDPHSSAAATSRQEAYARRLGRGGLYTPQAVVDGAAEIVGSDRAGLLRRVAEAAGRPKGTLELHAAGGGRLVVDARWEPGIAAEVWAAPVVERTETDVRAGENAGRRLVHASVARPPQRLGEGRGVVHLEVAPPRRADASGLVVWVQEPGGGRVLAVADGPPP